MGLLLVLLCLSLFAPWHHKRTFMTLKLFRWLGKRGLHRRKLRGTIFHKIFGDRLFARDLWKFGKVSVIKGWIIGCMIAGNPFLGIQLMVGIPLALIFRGNVFMVTALAFTTNPVTLGPFLMFCYAVGNKLTGENQALSEAQLVQPTFWESFRSGTFTTLIGCAIVSVVTALIGALLIHLFWRDKPLKEKLPKLHLPKHLPPALVRKHKGSEEKQIP